MEDEATAIVDRLAHSIREFEWCVAITAEAWNTQPSGP
jgi:hypothetical protein